MKFSIDPNIFQTFPGVSIGVLIVNDIVHDRNVDEIIHLLRQEEAKQKDVLNGVELGALPEIDAWREIYKKFGSNPHDFRSSVESLLRRVRAGKPLPEINPLVDAYNYLSLKYHLPAGAEDLDKVIGDISLTFSNGTEKGIALGFETEETPETGEVIYKDADGFLCRRWNWREADRTKIEEKTKRAIVVMEKAGVVDDGILRSALEEAKGLIDRYLMVRSSVHILDAAKPEILL